MRNSRGIGNWVPVAVVGAGPAGLAASTRLAQVGCGHVVLERARIGWSWRTQRWDSFRLNSPTWASLVPGEFLGGSAHSFADARSLVDGLERLAEGLPVFEGIVVRRAEHVGGTWRLETSHGPLLAGSVVVASGFQNVPRRPAYASALPREIGQLHLAYYRRPEDLEGAVLVVGGGQSGVQIAEDLLEAGHRVYLSTSRVGRAPRRYRGKDAFEWMRETGQLDLPREQADPAMIAATLPQNSAVAGGHTVSYQALAEAGATLLGRTLGWDGRRLQLAPDVGANVRFADEASAMFRALWDRQAARSGLNGQSVHDPADEPAEALYTLRGPGSLDLEANGISTIIWATGFGPSVGWLPPAALDRFGGPRLPNLHVIGAPWLTHRSSGNLYGMARDAERLACSFADRGVCAAA